MKASAENPRPDGNAAKEPWLRRALPWAFYDWANSAFAIAVMSAFVPILNQKFWSAGTAESVSTFRLGVANSTAGVVVAILAPILGAVADRGGIKKRLLLALALLGIVATAGLFFAAQGQWAFALVIYALATIGFSGANVCYDSLLPDVADRSRYDMVSALGFGLGYVGGGLLFGFAILMASKPGMFGLAGEGDALRWSFLCVSAWWLLFSLPLMVFVREKPGRRVASGFGETICSAFAQLRVTFREIRQLKVVWLFLLAYWLYIDGIHTIIRMAAAIGTERGFPPESVVKALLITQFVGFPSALVFGKLGERLGAKTGILIGIGVYIGVSIYGFFMSSVAEFYVLAVSVGLVQGGVQSLSRAFFARLIPADKVGEFFGFYNMLGKFAVIIGPLLMGYVGLATGSSRASILSLVVLFIPGALLLWRVKAPREEARESGGGR